MPEPQPAWAQQYNYEMKPMWARKFEPPAVAGDESQEVIETLMKISVATGDRRYLEPIPRALAYLRRSLLADGRLARYYELKTNTPLYMVRRGEVYTLTYDDSNLPGHYGWKWDSRLGELERQYESLKNGLVATVREVRPEDIRRVISEIDECGRWVSTYGGERLVGQVKMPIGAKYLSSELFSRNLSAIADFVLATRSFERPAGGAFRLKAPLRFRPKQTKIPSMGTPPCEPPIRETILTRSSLFFLRLVSQISTRA